MGRITLPPYSQIANLDGTGNFAVKKYYHWPFSFFYKKKLKMILDILEPKRHYYNILDFGCGEAQIFKPELSNLCQRVVCVDKAEDIDLRWSFDMVICASVLEFVELPVAVARLKMVTRPKGVLVVASPLNTWLTRLYFKLIGDTNKRHTEKEIIDEVAKRFFIVEYKKWLGLYFVLRGYPK